MKKGKGKQTKNSSGAQNTLKIQGTQAGAKMTRFSHSAQRNPTPLHYHTLPLESRGRSRRFQMATRHDDSHGKVTPLHYCTREPNTMFPTVHSKIQCTAVFLLFSKHIPPANRSAQQFLCSLFIFLPFYLYSQYSFIPLYIPIFASFCCKIHAFLIPIFHFFTAPPTTKSK